MRGWLGPELRRGLVDALAHYAGTAQRLGADHIVLMGTEPLRRAADAARVVHDVATSIGLPLHVLSHEEEGYLTLMGATGGRRAVREVLVVDVGGGSSELLFVGADRGHVAVGLRIGSARPTARAVEHDPPTADGVSNLRELARGPGAEAPARRPPEAKIKEVCLQFPEYPYLLSIPGFGPDVSAKVLGAIGDPFRFQNRKQVLKLAGLDLSADRSGRTSHTATPVISKIGKSDLRYALYQAALIASNTHLAFMKYYTEQLRGREREKGIKTKRRVKLSAKLLIIAWTLMKKKEAFNPVYLNQDETVFLDRQAEPDQQRGGL